MSVETPETVPLPMHLEELAKEIAKQVNDLDLLQLRILLVNIVMELRNPNYDWSDLTESVSFQIGKFGISTATNGERR